jgi:hypothetical protein
MNIINLEAETLDLIYSWLSVKERACFGGTCRAFHTLFKLNESYVKLAQFAKDHYHLFIPSISDKECYPSWQAFKSAPIYFVAERHHKESHRKHFAQILSIIFNKESFTCLGEGFTEQGDGQFKFVDPNLDMAGVLRTWETIDEAGTEAYTINIVTAILLAQKFIFLQEEKPLNVFLATVKDYLSYFQEIPNEVFEHFRTKTEKGMAYAKLDLAKAHLCLSLATMGQAEIRKRIEKAIQYVDALDEQRENDLVDNVKKELKINKKVIACMGLFHARICKEEAETAQPPVAVLSKEHSVIVFHPKENTINSSSVRQAINAAKRETASTKEGPSIRDRVMRFNVEHIEHKEVIALVPKLQRLMASEVKNCQARVRELTQSQATPPTSSWFSRFFSWN